MDKRFLGILAIIAVALVGVFIFTSHNNSPPASSGQPTNHVEGQGKSGVTLLEYGDYQCPVCEAYYLPLKQVFSQFSSQIHFQFRNLPLTSVHPNAFAGARAAEAAGLQTQYWQMHDLLYDNQSAWANSSNPQPYFDSYAQQLKLNMAKFDSDYAGSQVNSAINADIAAFSQTGQPESTPSIFLDGKFVQYSTMTDPNGAPNATKIAALVQAEINAKTKH